MDVLFWRIQWVHLNFWRIQWALHDKFFSLEIFINLLILILLFENALQFLNDPSIFQLSQTVNIILDQSNSYNA